MCASTGNDRSAAHSSLASSTVAAPSDSGVELPAVIVASGPSPNTGFSFASFSGEEPQRPRRRPRRVQLEQQLAEVVVELDGGVARRVEARRDAALDLAERDLVRDRDRRLEAGAARLLDVVGRRVRRQRAAEDALARQVEVAAVLEHPAAGDLAEPGALE